MAKIAPKLELVMIDGDSAEGDVLLIRRVAQEIRQDMETVGAARQWIKIGGRLASLKESLSRQNEQIPKGSNHRVPWSKAHQTAGPDGKPYLPFGRAMANMLIKVHEFFRSAAGGSMSRLPGDHRVLYTLATKFGEVGEVERLLEEEAISACTTREEIKKLGQRLGLIPPKQPSERTPSLSSDVSKDQPLERRLEAIFEYMARLNVTADDLLSHLGT